MTEVLSGPVPSGPVPSSAVAAGEGAPSLPRAVLLRLEAWLGAAIAGAAAALVAVEIGLLLCGIIARYGLHSPIIWADELATILFMWLAMLGAVVAFRHGAHMRMTALLSRASPGLRGLLEVLAITLPLAFLLTMLPTAIEYAEEEAFITTPALGIANSWRAAAQPVGLGLMALMGLLRLARVDSAGRALLGLALTGALVAGLLALAPLFPPLGNWNLLLFLVGGVMLAVLAGVPIAFAFALCTLGYLGLSTDLPIFVMAGRMEEGMSHLILLAVPLFVFLGLLIEMTGMAQAMVAFLASLLGSVRGGLSYVLIGAMYVVSGISGSKAADMAAIAPALFPEMKQRGARPGDLVALLSATGAQTETIPPSLVLITVGSVTGVSIAALFAGGILPAIVLGATLCAVVWRRYRHEDVSGIRRAPWGQILRSFAIALPALALPFIIRAAVVEGIATTTEVSTIGIVYAVLAGLLIYRRFDVRRLLPMLVETASLSGAILLIIGAATAMAWALTQSGFSAELARVMGALPGGAAGFMVVSILAFIVLGSVLEGIPAIVLFAPLLFPIAKQLGIHEVHYAMVTILAMGLGLFAPPFGVGYYTACAIGRVDPNEGLKAIWGYMAALFVGLAVVAAVPWISVGFL
ncbi:TRAP transporter large permease subunit [Roseomonas sp. GC11]|uniref:TRAP transporter large permease n=1 Tax=Roseomonas sp. GC11 TaxID=2950546 RepID=UPI00210CFE50|nr:TRAP transporter large permease subunit [Roseomonas sp. GC11]MCQ4159354.1 TRAP transporter large permease subunit [Roseomonas sp. GC11]